MAGGIDYELKASTSFSSDGKVLLWVYNPQTKLREITIVRDMTIVEIKRTVKILKEFGKRIYFNYQVLNRAGIL